MIKKIALGLFQFSLVVLLTVLTQVGGVVYVVSQWLSKRLNFTFRGKAVVVFLVVYLLVTFTLVPWLATLFGREQVRHSENIQPTNYMTVLLNRNYVIPAMNELLKQVEQGLKKDKIIINYLDANFPFLNGFPLLPHLSHNDGRKIDLSLVYKDQSGDISTKVKSVSGYGVFEEPKEGEIHQKNKCLEQGFFQYDYSQYLTLGRVNKNLLFSEKGTKRLVEEILAQDLLGKLFIEPHLKIRLKLENTKLRFHGCHAVRHDDHIHLQLK